MYLLVFVRESLLGNGRDAFALEQNLHRNLHQLVSPLESRCFEGRKGRVP